VPLLPILAAVLFAVPVGELARAAELCAKTMREAWVLEVPLKVGVEVGRNWADLLPLPEGERVGERAN
jgi:DNA polymerase I-like protein with 3'-5' exonuclease and polymerase domains